MSDERTDRHASPWRWIKWVVVGLVAVVALGYGAIFLYTEVINDSPDELDEGDLEAALTATTTAPGDEAPPTTGGAEPVTTDAAPATSAPGAVDTTGDTTDDAGGAASEVDGTWNVTDASELGYRVKEILFGVDTEAVGRTNDVTGAIVVAGAQVTDGDFEVDMATVASDRSQRDGQFRGRVMDVEQFPTATFVLTEPIELGAVPADGEQITATATGELTLRGVTNPVTFDVTAQREGDRIGVLGSIPVVFADYDIPNPSFGGIETEDNGVLEFVLVFERA
jgi:polyisoprenoid-binding protein YceI